MRHLIRMVLVATLVSHGAAAQGHAPAKPQPLPSGAAAKLWRDVEQQLIAFEADLLVGDYRSRCGKRTPDVDFEALLRKGGFMQLPHTQHMTGVLDRVAHRGPIDPLMHWYAAEIGTEPADRERQYQLAIDGLQRAGAGPFVRFMVRNRARIQLGANAASPLFVGLQDDLVACAGDPRMAGIGQRLLISMFRLLWEQVGPDQRPLVDRMLAAKNPDRYAALTLDGMCHVNEGWAARSNKASAEVTEAGWKGFNQHLKAAAKSLTEANRQHPEFPEASSQMISVCGGSGAIDDIRGWLDAAVAAEFDYTGAYMAALHFYSVRWGGSLKLQLELGQECARTERFDTLVPQMLRNAIGLMANDVGKDLRDSFTEPLQQQLDAMHRRRIEHLTTFEAARWELSQRAVELIMFRRTRQGVELIKSIAGGLDPAATATFGGVPKFVQQMVDKVKVGRVVQAMLPVEMFAGHERAEYPGLAAAKPLPVASTRPSQAALVAEWSRFYAELTGAHYRARTDDPASLRDRAAAALAQFPPMLARQPGAPLPTDLLCTLQALETEGAKDPLLAYCRGRCHELNGEDDAALAAYEVATSGMQRLDYAPLFPFLVLRRVILITAERGKEAEAARLQIEASRLLRLAARMPEWRADARRHYVALAWPDERIPAQRGELTTEDIGLLAADEQVDPWVRTLLEGLDCCQRALSRPQNPFDGRKDHFVLPERANQLLRRAHSLHPEAPQAATAMISVCHFLPQPEPGRHWFDAAVAAQFDYTPAYASLTVLLSPMAGGRLGDMMHFAMECLATGRFDTAVPRQFLTMMAVATQASPGFERWLWSAPSARRGLDRLAAGHADQPLLVRHYEELRMVTDWAGGNYESALTRWRALGRPTAAASCEQLGFAEETVLDELRFLQQRADAAAAGTGK